MRIGFIGLGIMGREMAQHIAKKGYDLVVWNRSAQILDEFKANGYKVASSIAEMAVRVDAIVSCVTNESALSDVYLGESGVLRTIEASSNKTLKFVIDCSTVSPEFVRKLSDSCSKLNIMFSDSPVTGGDVGAKNGTLNTMVGASEALFEEILPILNCFSKEVFHMGNVGAGQEAKCVNQIGVACAIAAMTESLFFCEEKGLPIEKMLKVLQGGAAGSWALSNYAPRVIAGSMGPGFFAKDMLKDLRIVLKEAESSKTPLPVTGLIKELYTSLINKKGEGLGNHALIEIYRELVS